MRTSSSRAEGGGPVGLVKSWLGPRPWRWIVLSALVLGVRAAPSFEWEMQFEEANRLYEQERFVEAIERYEALAGTVVSPDLLFNLGNAYYRHGQPGRALYYFRLAQELNPRDRDISDNLRFVRERVEGGFVAGDQGWRRLGQILRLNELTLLTMAAGWIWFGLLIARNLKPGWRGALQSGVTASGILFGAFCLWMATALLHRATAPEAVVISPEAIVRYGPLEQSKEFYSLKEGAEVKVRDQRRDWLQVEDRQGRLGWAPRADLALATWRAGKPDSPPGPSL